MYKVPDVERYEFQVPGDETVHSIPSMLDLPPEKLKALTVAGNTVTDDPSALHELMESLPDEADTATRTAMANLTLSQKVKFFKAYAESVSLDQGESSAS
jgi:hypothetical protein